MDYFVFLLDNMVKIYKYVHICISKLLQYYYIFAIFFNIFFIKFPLIIRRIKQAISLYVSPVHLCC